MSIDTSGLAFPKPGKKRKTKDTWRHDDVAGTREAVKRSKGYCELPWCVRRATQTHHLLGGHGQRGRGESSLVDNKVCLCTRCHASVHVDGKVVITRNEDGAWVAENHDVINAATGQPLNVPLFQGDTR